MTQSGLLTHPMVSDWVSFDRPDKVLLQVGKVEIGQGIAVALARIAAEELDVDPGRIEMIAGDTNCTPDEGFTAGSMSIEICGATVRDAASAARCLLVAAARIAPRSIADGAFLTGDGPTGESYWTVAPKADLRLPVAEWARPKPHEDYRLIGRTRGGVDLYASVTGAAFIHDIAMPNMLHARLVRGTSLEAKIDEISELILPADVHLVQDSAFVGVIAPREEQAVATAERVAAHVRWRLIEDDRPEPLRQIFGASTEDDQTDAQVGKGNARRIEIMATRDFIAHASIGPSCAIALWESGQLTVWSHSQGVFALRAALADLFYIDKALVRVIHVRAAGCYGHNGADDAAADAAMLAREVTGRPVRVLWTRAQEMTNSPVGAAMKSTIIADLDDAGMIVATRTEVVSGSHARRPGGGGINLLAGYLREATVTGDEINDPPLALGGGADRNALPGYAIAKTSSNKKIILNSGVRTSSLRSLGAHVNITAIEAMMDEAAALSGVDPIAYRLSHLVDPRARAVVERVAEMSGWPRSEFCGIGYAQYKNKAAYCAVVAEVALSNVVRVARIWCAADAGFAVDPDGVLNQIEGGIIQSISWTLKESVPIVRGVPVVEGWQDYPILSFDEVPDVQVALIDHSEQPSLGVGEAAQGPAAAAVANAVSAALGCRISSLPITRDRIIEALSSGTPP